MRAVGRLDSSQDPAPLFRRRSSRRRATLRAGLHGYRIPLTLSALLLAVNGALLYTLAPPRLDLIALDFFFRSRPPIRTDPSIIAIEISEDGLAQLGRWPWPRQYHAALTHALRAWGAKAVVFDILFSEPSAPLDDGAFAEAIAESGAVYLPVVQETQGGHPVWLRPLPALEQACRGTGHINAAPDRDGIVRRVRPFLSARGEPVPHLALRVAFDLQGKKPPLLDQTLFPLDRQGDLLVNWSGRWIETFQHISYLDVLRSFEAIRTGRKPLLSPESFRGKVCLIGLTAAGHADIKPVPVEPTYPGLGVHANLLSGILTGQFVAPVSRKMNLLALLALGGMAGLAFLLLRPGVDFAACLALACGWVFFAWVLFCRCGSWISVAYPLFSAGGIFLIWAGCAQVAGELERRRLSALASRDGLTGLYVIRHFRSLLNAAAEEAHRKGAPLSVLMLDIDHFKKVNDTHGHEAGDSVLRQVAALLRSRLRETDDAGRYGGEELIVMLPGVSLKDSAVTAEEIRRAVAEGTASSKESVPVTVSIGAATLRADEAAPDPMVHRADAALYRAKEGGRNRVVSEESLGA